MAKVYKVYLYRNLALGVLLGLLVALGLIGWLVSEGFFKDLFVNITATALYVLIAYFTYDLAKRFARKELNRETQEYAESYVSPHIASLLFSLMELIYTKSELPNVHLLDQLHELKQKELSKKLLNKKYLGFDVFQDAAEMNKDIKELLENSFLISRLDESQILILVKISNRITKLRYQLSRRENLAGCASDDPHLKYKVMKSQDISEHNEHLPNRRILLEIIEGTDRGIVKSFGDFDKQVSNEELIKSFRLHEASAPVIAGTMVELLSLINEWVKLSRNGLVIRVR